MNERTLTAMYDTRSAAETARDELVAIGVPSADITIRGAGTSGDMTASDDKSFWEELKDLFVPDEDRYTYAEGMRRGGHLLTARVPAGSEDAALDILDRSDPVDVDQRSESWRSEGWRSEGYRDYAAAGSGAGLGAAAGYGATNTATPSTSRDYGTGGAGRSVGDRDEDVIEVAEEQLRVGKREVDRGGVRVRSYVRERPVEEQVQLRDERVHVERRPVDRPVEAGHAAFQEKVIEATERGEEAVIDKQTRMKEEIALRKDVDTHTETVRDTVREQEVEIEDERTGRGGPAGDSSVGGTGTRRTGGV